MTPSRQQREQLADSLGVASVDDLSPSDQWELLGDPAKREALAAKLDADEAAGGKPDGDLNEFADLDQATEDDIREALAILEAPPAVKKPTKPAAAAPQPAGGWDEDGFLVVTQQQMRSPAWCRDNQADVTKAAAAGILRILPG